MSKVGLIAFLGLLLAFMPFLGLPLVVKTPLTVLFGIMILVLGFLVREERRWLLRALRGEHETDAYSESGLGAQAGAQGYAKEEVSQV